MKRLSRRTTIVAGLSVVAGGGFGVFELLAMRRRHYPSTPYDDLLSQLDDRDRAVKLGRASLAELRPNGAQMLSTELRAHLGHARLSEVVASDARKGALVEANGWVLPETLAKLCALAALVAEHQSSATASINPRSELPR